MKLPYTKGIAKVRVWFDNRNWVGFSDASATAEDELTISAVTDGNTPDSIRNVNDLIDTKVDVTEKKTGATFTGKIIESSMTGYLTIKVKFNQTSPRHFIDGRVAASIGWKGGYIMMNDYRRDDGELLVRGLVDAFECTLPEKGEIVTVKLTDKDTFQAIVNEIKDDVTDANKVQITLLSKAKMAYSPEIQAGEPQYYKIPERINFRSNCEDVKARMFSNFSPHSVFIYGRMWKTAEHAYQAQKFLLNANQTKIANCETPGQAKRMGGDKTMSMRKDWDSVKVSIMYQIVRNKVAQHDDVREYLLATGNRHIAEHTTQDKFWGDGGDDSGKNMLGRILMLVREEIR